MVGWQAVWPHILPRGLYSLAALPVVLRPLRSLALPLCLATLVHYPRRGSAAKARPHIVQHLAEINHCCELSREVAVARDTNRSAANAAGPTEETPSRRWGIVPRFESAALPARSISDIGDGSRREDRQ